MIYEQWDVALSLFPFTDRPVAKARPVVVLSNASFHRQHDMVVTAMITTAGAGRLATDHELIDLASAGLRHASFVRWKIMTLATAVMSRRIGSIARADRIPMTGALATILPTGTHPRP